MPREWQVYRRLRLQALSESPDAFGRTYEEESKRPDSFWMDRLRAGASSARYFPVVADDNGKPVGLAWGLIDDDDPSVAAVTQMWVDPAYRGRGVGSSMLDVIVEWARALGLKAVRLGVTVGNSAAEELYRRAGFVPIGEPSPLREGSKILSRLMELKINE